MKRYREATLVPVLAALVLLAAAPVAAQGIPAGDDTWATPATGGNTWVDLNGADWEAICKSNSNSVVRVTFKGVELDGQGDGSVVVKRIDDAVFDSSGIAQVTVRMTTLEFESVSTTSTPCGNLDFRLGLNGEQSEAEMEIRRQGSWGGYFFVDLPVNAVIEAIDPSTEEVVGSVIRDGTLYEPTGGTVWSYKAPGHALDPGAPWHPGVTSTGQRQTIIRQHTFPASHAYKPVIYCGGVSVASAATASEPNHDIAQPSPCAEPVDRTDHESLDTNESNEYHGATAN